MKKVKIISKVFGEMFGEFADPTAWIAECVTGNAWGKPERWVLHKDELGAEAYDNADVIAEEEREAVPALAAVVDEQGVEIAPAVPAVMQKWVKLKAEYTVEIEDITAQVEQQRVNQEALAYLALTDWYIIREMDQGTPCPAEVKAERAAARARIVR